MKNSNTFSLTRRTLLKTGAASVGGLALGGLATPSIASSDKELSFMVAQPQAPAVKMVAEAFLKETGIKINSVVVPFPQVYQQIALDQQSGANRFDAFTYWYGTLGALVSNGLVQDVTDRIDKDAAQIQPDDYIDSLYDPFTLYEGRRYGLPFDGDAHALYYNLEVFDRMGVSPPKTWDELNTLTEHLTNELKGEGIYGHALIGMPVPVLNISTFSNRVANYGGTYLTPDGMPNLTSPEVIAAAQNMAAIAPHCSPTPVEIGYTEGLDLFLAGKAAMTEGWTDLGINANLDADSKIKNGWGMVPLPTLTGNPADSRGSLNAGYTIGLSARTQKADMAWEFVKYITGVEWGETLIATNGTAIDPFRKSAIQSQAYREKTGAAHGAIVSVFENAFAWPSVPDAPQMLEILSVEVGTMLAGQKSAEQAMKTAQRSWERILS